FTHLATNATRVVWAALNLELGKKGPKSEISISAKDFDYFFADTPAGSPAFKGKASAQTNLLSFMSQEQLNLMGPYFDKLVLKLADTYMKDYGNAIALNAKVSDIRKDPKGNL